MSQTTVDAGFVVPVSVFETIIVVISAVTFCFLCKYSCTRLASEEELEKSDVESVCCYNTFLSPVHGWAVVYFCFLLDYAISILMFTTIFGFRPNCFWAINFQSVGWVGSKTCQYGFFITRLVVVFKESSFKIQPSTSKILYFFAALYCIGNVVIITIATIRNPGAKLVRAGAFEVCIGVETEFQFETMLAALLYILCDAVIMITVAYGFVSRLLKLASISSNDRQLVKTLNLALKSFVLYLFSVSTSLMNIVVVMIYPHNLMGPFAPLFDTFLNGMAIFAMFRFGDGIYRLFCACFDPCVVSALLCCCSGGDETLRLLLADSRVKKGNAVAPQHHHVASVTQSNSINVNSSPRSGLGDSTASTSILSSSGTKVI